MDDRERITKALEIANDCASIDGTHHKAWVIDQMVRALTDCPMVKKRATDYRGNGYEYEDLGEADEYRAFIAAHNAGEDGPDTYNWECGIAP